MWRKHAHLPRIEEWENNSIRRTNRPNIHIKDMANVYRHFLKNQDIKSGCYNAGFENTRIIDIARSKRKTGAEIVVSESNDPRSYRQDSSKLMATGFKPQYNISTAIDEISQAFEKED